MHDTARFEERGAWMREALHDLCQPLTALECGLFVASMIPGAQHEMEDLRQAVLEGLAHCERAMRVVRAMQLKLNEEPCTGRAGGETR